MPTAEWTVFALPHWLQLIAEWRYRRRVVIAEDLLFIRRFIAQNAGDSRRQLSAKLCQAWEWKQANGALCDMVCSPASSYRKDLPVV